jgi:NosR/NirI family transcriptional regulator, nitrous oxide reductase regulator
MAALVGRNASLRRAFASFNMRSVRRSRKLLMASACNHREFCKFPAMSAQLSSALIALVLLLSNWALAYADSRLIEFASKATPNEFFPEATRFGDQQGEPPILPVFAADRLVGYVYLNTDFTGAVGYSGKPVSMLVGIDKEGVIKGLKLVEHKEPIVLVGVPERRVVEAVNKLVGTSIGPIAAGKERPPQPDIVSGATVTILVMADSVIRSAVKLVRSGRLSSAAQKGPEAAPLRQKSIDKAYSETRNWDSLLADGSIGRLRLSIAEINQAFEKSGKAEAAANPEPGDPKETFIDLYVALVSVPTIGKSLLGEAAYERLRDRLGQDDDNHDHDNEKPANAQRQAIIVAANGIYSFKGSGYVRGGIFDRIELLQDGNGTRFRDRDHERIGALEAAGAPVFKEIGVFIVPEDFAFDPTEPWELHSSPSISPIPFRTATSKLKNQPRLHRHLSRRRLLLVWRRNLSGSRCGGEAQSLLASQLSPSSC